MFGVLFTLVSLYIVAGFATYGYAVYKNFEVTEIWVFKMDKEYIGICRYPKWLLFWMYWLGVKLKWI